jgi:HlyD family secretion protein
MKKYKWMIWVGLIVVVGVIIWFWKFRKEDPKIVLDTVKPVIGSIATTITATGTIQPVDTVAVGTQVSGTIKNVYADFNSVVKKGQLLAQLDKSLLQAQVQQVDANLQQTKSTLVYQESNYNRQKQLYDVGAISKADLETALNGYNVAKDNVTSAAAQVQSAQKNLSYSDIYSPIDGTVLSRNVSEGQTVAASFSTPTLFSIAKDLTKMQVRAAIDEADIGNVKVGQRATFNVDAFPDKDFSGTVKEVRLQASVSSNVVTYVTIIDAPNDNLKLKPGMTANIILYTKEVPDALIIPAKALNFKPDSLVAKKYTVMMPDMNGKKYNSNGTDKKGTKDTSAARGKMKQSGDEDSVKRAAVWVKQDSTLTRKRITIGLDDQTQVQVLSGLTADDEVVTGYHLLTKEASKKAATDKSPFLPSRPGGNGNRKNSSQPRPPQ